MAQIRQEINILCEQISAAGGASFTSSEIIQLDTTQYTSPTYYFEVVADSTVSISFNVTLRRKGTSTDDATCNIPLLTTAFTRIRSVSFTPPAGQTEYVVFIDATAGATKNVKSARIIILQNASPIAKTETQIDIGNKENSTSATLAALGSPKYWTYTSANWNGTITVFWETVLNSQSTKITATAQLQVADGTGNGFTGWTAVGSDITSSAGAAERKRSAAITLTAGRNYRVVYKTSNSKSGIVLYGAKIILDQNTNPTLLEPQYLVSNTTFGTTGLQSFLTKWDSTEWSGVTNTYKHAGDSAGGLGNVVEIDTAGGTQVTGSSITVNAPQVISGSLTMPSGQDLDCNITNNSGNDFTGARILVAVSVNVDTRVPYRNPMQPILAQ